MDRKSTNEECGHRVKALEEEIAKRDQEMEALRKACREVESGMESRLAKLAEVNLKLKQEIEEHALAEQALMNSQHLLQAVMDTIEGEVFVKDANGKYQFVNKAFGKDFEVDPKDVVGKDDFFIFPPEAAAILQENDKRIMAAKEAENVEESGIFKGKNITYLTNKVPLIDDNGNVTGICGVGFDITWRKELEKALKDAHLNLEKLVKQRTAQLSETIDKLREAELRYRTVADFTYDWEDWMNLDGTFQYVSPSCERISGYTPQQFMDTPSLLSEIIIPEDQDTWEKHCYDACKEPKTREIEFRIRDRDGATRWIEHVCQPVRGDEGQLLGFRATNRDITDRKEEEKELQSAILEIKQLKAQLEADQTYLREEIKLEGNYGNILGESDVMKYVLFRAEQIAPSDTTVLILGETGTGKELVARAIHDASSRKGRPLIKVDCASLPANLIESELFGHQKGAFTGAFEKRVGRFELANGTTLFLDEIGELPVDLQSKLLRVLQDGEFERLGSSETLRTDVRVIAATNRNLEEDVRNKRFRMDLWYRLSVFTISIPPLRERREDIRLLVDYMVKKFEKKYGKRIRSVPTHIFKKLQGYSWPGNVRELENVIERAVIGTKAGMLQLEDSLALQPAGDTALPGRPIKSLEAIEREHILLALRETNWKIHGKDGAAALLDINPSTLRGRIRKHGIHRYSYETRS